MNIFHIVTNCIFWLLIVTIVSVDASTCTLSLYSDPSMQKEEDSFEAGQKIYLKIDCSQIPPGVHNITVDWIKENYGIVRSDSRNFFLKIELDREMQFWMKLDEKGILNQLVSTSEYSQEMMGRWTVNPKLDGKSLGSANFTIY